VKLVLLVGHDMSHVIIAMPYLSDAAVLTGTEEAYGPLSNLQLMQPSDAWATAGGTPYVVMDLGGVQSFNVIALLRTNATGVDQWRIRTADTEANLTNGSETYDSFYQTMSWLGSQGDVYAWNSVGWSNRWIRIDLIAANDPYTVGRLYVGNAFQPVFNYKYGLASGYVDESTISTTDGGNLIPTHGTNRQTLDITLNLRTAAEAHTVKEINRLRGGSRDVLIIVNPDEATYKADQIYYGILQPRRATVLTAFNWHEISYQLKAL